MTFNATVGYSPWVKQSKNKLSWPIIDTALLITDRYW